MHYRKHNFGRSMQRAAVIVKEPKQQHEGLRLSVGLQLAGMKVQFFVLHHEIENMNDACLRNMAFLDKNGGMRFSDHPGNAEKYGFTLMDITRSAEKIRQADVIIPF